jgi:GNAT superfamily N-acetyltransferase
MQEADEYFASTCSHVQESAEIDRAAEKRLAWFHEMQQQGLSIKIAHMSEQPIGMLYLIPIKHSPWGPLGQDLLVIPCLFVMNEAQGDGAGEALMQAAEDEAARQKTKGLVTTAYDHDFWFMPMSFFEAHGFTEADRQGNTVLMWKNFDPAAQSPQLLKANYAFTPVPGKVVVDLFWTLFCQTSAIEAQRVREVVTEFGDDVVLREYQAEARETLLNYQIPRAIYVNGKEIGWGYEAPKEGIRTAIERALDR